MVNLLRLISLPGIFRRRPRPKRSLRLRARGQATLEFALTLPILLLLLLGIIEFGRLMFSYIAVVTAVRESARYGAASGFSGAGVPYYQDCDGIRAAAIRIGSIAGLSNTAVSIQINFIGPRTVSGVTNRFTALGNCPVGGTGPNLMMGDRIVVIAMAPFTPTSGIVPNLPSLQIRSLSRRTILVSVPLR